MITVVSGTNRPGSNTLRIARFYRQLLEEKGREARLLSLEQLHTLTRDEGYIQLEAEWLLPADKFVFVVPEYNGSIPGVCKLFIDLADWRKAWGNKKALLAGVANGRAGNLRGMDHLTAILHHLNVQVLPNKLPISQVHLLLNAEGELVDEPTRLVIEKQIDEFLNF